MRKLEVAFSPALLDHYDFADSLVVVIDVFRATTTICTALNHGAEFIVPVVSIEECMSYREKGFLVAAERDGLPIPDFDFDNSPRKFTSEKVQGKKIALTTTNGTYTIHKAKNCHQIIIASFLNLDSVCRYIKSQDKNVLIACSGTRNKFKLEDTICAGAIVEQIKSDFSYVCESSIGALRLFELAKQDMIAFVYQSSHADNYIKNNLQEDIKYSLQMNIFDNVPIFDNNKITL